MLRLPITRLALAIGICIAAPALHARPAPAGFEDVVDGQQEQLDVRLMGRSGGMATALVTADSVLFDNPEKVLAGLPLSDDARLALLPALRSPLARNTQLACRYGAPTTGCGYLPPPEAPDQVRLIYDEGEGAVHLFVAQQWLPTERDGGTPYHQISDDAQNALIHQHSMNLSGSNDYQNLTVNGNGMLGVMRQGHVAVDWTFVRQDSRYRSADQHLSVNDLYYRHDLGQRHYLQAGRMDRRNLSSAQGGNFGFGMLPLDRFEGARIGTTQAYLDQQQLGQGSPLTVLLSRNARVDALDGDRLLQSYYLDAGINELDTTRFPGGSYLVTLRIYEDGVLARTEDAPFNKNGQPLGDGTLQWFAQGGRRAARSFDREGDESLFQAGLRVPLHEQVAMTLGVAAVDGVRYAEGRLDARHAKGPNEVNATVAWLGGSDGSHGVQQQVSYRRYLSWNFYNQRMRGSACRGEYGDTRDSLGCQDSLSASVSMPLAGGNLYLGYTRRVGFSWQRDPDLPPGPDLPWLPPPGQPLPSNLQSQVTRTLQASFNRSTHWQGLSISTRAGLYRQKRSDMADDNGVYLSLAVSRLARSSDRSRQDRISLDLQRGDVRGQELGWRVGQVRRWDTGSGYKELGAELNGRDTDRYGALVSGRLQNELGASAATVSGYRTEGRSEMSYSATYTSGLAVSRAGWFVGSGFHGGAGVAVRVDDAEDLALLGPAAEVNVSGSRRQVLHFGQRRLLPMAAYTAGRAEVQDVSAHDSAAAVRVSGLGVGQRLFLPPGKVLHMPVALDVTYTFVGTARGMDGHPLEGARVLNAPVPALSRGGGFVADFPQREQMLYLLQGDRLLQCPLTVRERRSVLLLVGQVQCEPLAVDQLPAPIHQQARVQRLLQEHELTNGTASSAAVETRK